MIFFSLPSTFLVQPARHASKARRAGIQYSIFKRAKRGLAQAEDILYKAFLGHFRRVSLVISKGQGNYETLSREEKPIFFLLKAKCPVVAKDLGVKQGDTVIKYALR